MYWYLPSIPLVLYVQENAPPGHSLPPGETWLLPRERTFKSQLSFRDKPSGRMHPRGTFFVSSTWDLTTHVRSQSTVNRNFQIHKHTIFKTFFKIFEKFWHFFTYNHPPILPKLVHVDALYFRSLWKQISQLSFQQRPSIYSPCRDDLCLCYLSSCCLQIVLTVTRQHAL